MKFSVIVWCSATIVFVPGVSTTLKSRRKSIRLITFGQPRRNLDRSFFVAVLENVNAIGRGQHIDLGKFLTEERIEQRRFARFHFSDDNKEQRLANIRDQAVDDVERWRIALQLDLELEQVRKRSFEFASKLQIIIGDHAGYLNCRGGMGEA